MLGDKLVEQVLADLATAPIGEPLRATLGFLRKVTKDHGNVAVGDVQALRTLGVTRAQIEDALAVLGVQRDHAPRGYVRVRGRSAGCVRRRREAAARARLQALSQIASGATRPLLTIPAMPAGYARM